VVYLEKAYLANDKIQCDEREIGSRCEVTMSNFS
jgi:hypothetical protein